MTQYIITHSIVMTISQKKIILYTTAVLNLLTDEAHHVGHGDEQLLVPHLVSMAQQTEVVQAESPYLGLTLVDSPHIVCA